MVSILSALLCLGLFLGKKSWTQSGNLPKPSIRAVPSPVAPQGSALTILCKGPPGTSQHRLEHAGTSQVWHEKPLKGSWGETKFSFQNITSSHAGSYLCQYKKLSDWSERSDPLELAVTGVFNDKPTLSAQPSPMVTLGGSVTLRCHLPNTYDTFILSKGRRSVFLPVYTQKGRGNFLFSPVTRDHAGIYRCYGSLNTSSNKWSVPSDPVVVMVTGVYKKPFLVDLEGPSATSQKKTLQCGSHTWFDWFLLSQEGSANSTQLLKSQYKAGLFQANFTTHSGRQAQGSTYRCYGSLETFPSLWSEPSEPLRVVDRGSVTPNYTLENALRLGLGGVFLLILLGLLVDAWLSRRQKNEATQ
ncbi:leukocyte immunoglobulin-like receptor subfamily A member 2 [Choloepus didactylus]|uniref:leukocyte immunoglobulin-like receptor subfamily A member 2 n=1 Tax=Choloepus didactylus TaxID=27675 RepID=UPI00189DA499|nr:leukocyte immunoglobulin-like receptor subfamily A member 2 [Choloepus didactylus]